MSAHLSIDRAAAIDFYASVFCATERLRMGMPDGTVAHAGLDLGGSVITIGEEMPGGEPENHFYGDRVAMLDDPFGHRWNIASHVEDVPPDEMERRAAEAIGQA